MNKGFDTAFTEGTGTAMPVDMKEVIAEAAVMLMMDKNVKKLTVKDIVQECHITRQTFYYHFEDIPHLLHWMMEEGLKKVKKEAELLSTDRERIRYFILMSINLKPYIERTMQSNYARELEVLLQKELNRLFEVITVERQLFPDLSHRKQRLVLRYHMQAILGILKDWTDEDTKNLDEIVDIICLLIEGKVPYQGSDVQQDLTGPDKKAEV